MAFGSGRKIVVEFIGDASALRNATRDGEAALQGFSGKAQAAGRIAGKALAGGLLLAGVAAVKATQAAAEDEAAQSQLAQQLKQAAGATDTQVAATEKWITAQGLAKGVADDELRPALARLATATGDVEKAQRLATLAMSVSAGTGKSLDQVTTALAKAQNGNIGGLGRLGIATKDAAGHTKTLSQITQDLSDKYKGSAAKAAETTAGKQKILSVQFHELQEQIGTQLLPVMQKLAEVGLKVVDWISKNTQTVGILVGSFAGLLAVVTLVGAATKTFTAISSVWSAATKVAAAAQWLLNAALSANPLGLIVIAIAALAVGLVVAYKKSETFRNIVNGAFNAVAKTVGVVVDFIKDHWRLLAAILLGPFGIAIGLISKHWDTIKAGAQVVIEWIKQNWPALKQRITAPIEAAKAIIGDIWGVIKAGFGVVRDKISGDVGMIKSAFTTGFGAVKSVIQSVVDKVQSLINLIGSLISKAKSIHLPHIPGLRTSAGSGAKGGLVGGTKDDIAAAYGVLGKVSEATQKHIDKLKDKLKAVKDLFKSLRDSVAGAFTGDIFQASSASEFVSGLSGKSGTLSALSAAFKTLMGWGWKPQALAAMFQSGNAGLILDLAANKDLAQQGAGLYNTVTGQADALGAQVGTGVYGGEIDQLTGQIKGAKDDKSARTVNVTVNMGLVTDPVAAAREVVKAVRQLERATGRQLLVTGG